MRSTRANHCSRCVALVATLAFLTVDSSLIWAQEKSESADSALRNPDALGEEFDENRVFLDSLPAQKALAIKVITALQLERYNVRSGPIITEGKSPPPVYAYVSAPPNADYQSVLGVIESLISLEINRVVLTNIKGQDSLRVVISCRPSTPVERFIKIKASFRETHPEIDFDLRISGKGVVTSTAGTGNSAPVYLTPDGEASSVAPVPTSPLPATPSKTTPTTPASDVERLKRNYAELENEIQALTSEIKTPDKSRDSEQLQEMLEELEAIVEKAFAQKTLLQQARLIEFSNRMKSLRKSIDERQNQKKALIKKHVKELLRT